MADLCQICGGDHLERRRVSYLVRDGEQMTVVAEVPATVCQQCGEITYSPEVLEKISQILREGPPPDHLKVPLYRFPS